MAQTVIERPPATLAEPEADAAVGRARDAPMLPPSQTPVLTPQPTQPGPCRSRPRGDDQIRFPLGTAAATALAGCSFLLG